MDALYYRPIQTDISQGDIFTDVPHVLLRPPIRVVRESDYKPSGRTIFGQYLWPTKDGESPELPKAGVKGGGFQLEPPKGEEVAAFCQVSKAIALNHDCDIENDSKHRTIAMIYPLSIIKSGEVDTREGKKELKDVIRSNGNRPRYYLPAIADVLEESFVDFRRISTVAPGFLSNCNRITSLSEDAFKALLLQLLSFISRMSIEFKTEPS